MEVDWSGNGYNNNYCIINQPQRSYLNRYFQRALSTSVPASSICFLSFFSSRNDVEKPRWNVITRVERMEHLDGVGNLSSTGRSRTEIYGRLHLKHPFKSSMWKCFSRSARPLHARSISQLIFLVLFEFYLKVYSRCSSFTNIPFLSRCATVTFCHFR